MCVLFPKNKWYNFVLSLAKRLTGKTKRPNLEQENVVLRAQYFF